MDTALQSHTSTPHIHDLTVLAPVTAQPPAPHGVKRTFVAFVVCLVLLFASGIALSIQFAEVDGPLLWVMVIMGSVIIAILLTGILLPFVKELREHRAR